VCVEIKNDALDVLNQMLFIQAHKPRFSQSSTITKTYIFPLCLKVLWLTYVMLKFYR